MAPASAYRGGGGLSLCLASVGVVKMLSVAALCLLGDFAFSDTVGFILAAAVVVWQWRQRPSSAVAAA